MWGKIKGFAKKHPNITSLITFILFFSAFAYYLGWILSFIVSVSLAIHEYSHAFTMKKLGMRVEAVIFIPFLGAIALGGGDRPWTRREECLTAMAGPLAGYLSAVPVYALFKMTGNELFLKALILILILNLFNMLPLSPLDGGRVIKSLLMSFKNKMNGFFLWVVLAIGTLYVLWRIGASFIIVGLVAFWAWQELLREWKLYKMRQKILEWIDEECRCKASAEEVFASLKEGIQPGKVLVYLENDLGRLLRDICSNELDVMIAIMLLKDNLNPPYLAPLTIRQRIFSGLMFLALLAVPVLFYLGLR